MLANSSGKQIALRSMMWIEPAGDEVPSADRTPFGSAVRAASQTFPVENMREVFRPLLVQQLGFRLPVQPAQVERAVAVADEFSGRNAAS